ncbi:TetR/AcrR family transcriptional regulator [uncultured Sphingomonas sp.]|uniref:TetR/AcrR family transcriptional regulator n=1 Tax=uncultured Sphingomonas sp. TaxID=158754 RepID=UPI0035C96038
MAHQPPAAAVNESEARRPRAGRPAQALITRAKAATVALRLIDRDGLDALSLQGVARELGVKAPSLYHHFRHKEELLTQVARQLLEEVNNEREVWSTDWEQRTIELSSATRRIALKHPNAAPLTLRFFPRQLMLPAYERQLIDCPYPVEAHAVILESVEKFTYGTALFAAAAEAHHIPAMPIIDGRRFPYLERALEMAPEEEAIFVESLRVLLAGFRARYGRRASP